VTRSAAGPELRALPKRLWSAAMSAARARFGQDTSGSVLAFGVGPDIRKGIRRRAHTLNVYVRTKFADPAAPIEQLRFRAGGAWVSVGCNVVATGKPARANANGPGGSRRPR